MKATDTLPSPARSRAGLALALVAACAGVAVAAQQPSSPRRTGAPVHSPGPDPGTPSLPLGADLTVRHHRIRADGSPAGPAAPTVVVRLDRVRRGGRWRTSLALRSTEPAHVLSLNGPRSVDNPYAIVRMEFDDDGTPPRMFDRSGRLASLPGPADRRLVEVTGRRGTAAAAPDELVARLPAVVVGRGPGGSGLLVEASAGAGAERRAGLGRRFGRAAGRVGRLDRFVTRANEATTEVLVDPDTALPVAVSQARGGRLVSRADFEYDAFGSTWLLRRRVRAEREIPAAAGDRVVTIVEVSDVTIPDGGRP